MPYPSQTSVMPILRSRSNGRLRWPSREIRTKSLEFGADTWHLLRVRYHVPSRTLKICERNVFTKNIGLLGDLVGFLDLTSDYSHYARIFVMNILCTPFSFIRIFAWRCGLVLIVTLFSYRRINKLINKLKPTQQNV